MQEPLPHHTFAYPVFLSVVLPAYNEQAAIVDVILDHVVVLSRLHNIVNPWEIICVDDASSDGTPALLDRLSRSIPQLRVIRHSANRGIFQSFADGFAAAKGTHVYATGGDGQWPARNLERMLRPVFAGCDLVVGVRPNRREVYSLKRRFVSFVFNSSARLLFGVDTRDAGGIKLGVRDVFRFQLSSKSPFVEAERIIRAEQRGYRVDFVAVEFNRRRSGRETGAKWSNLFASARDCVRCAAAVYGFARNQARKTSARPAV